MKVLSLFVVSILLFGFAVGEDDSPAVIEMTEDNFEDVLDEHDMMLIEFFAPWCGHCKNLAPEFENAAQKFVKSGSNVRLGAVDCTIHKSLGQKHIEKGYPTIKWFVNGKAHEYTGTRNTDGIVRWILNQLKIDRLYPKSLDELHKSNILHDLIVLGSFKTEDGKKAFEKAANAHENVMHAITDSEEIRTEYGIKEDGIVYLRNFEPKSLVYDGEFTKKDILAWAQMNAVGLVTKYNLKHSAYYYGTGLKYHLVLLTVAGKKNDKFDEEIKVLTEAATKLHGTVLALWIDAGDELAGRMLNMFDRKPSDAPSFFVVKTDNKQNFIPAKMDITVDNIVNYVEEVQVGKAKEHLKSETLPASWDSKPVKYVVASNYNKVVLDKSKVVFVKFYAPWCGHCKTLAPIWVELAEHFADNDNVEIVEVDSTANDIPDLKIQSFPTLKLFQKGDNKMVDYSGARDLQPLIKFVEKHLKLDDVKYDKTEL